MPQEVSIPLEKYQFLYPFKALLPPLVLPISAWALILNGRKEVLDMIRVRLQDYEDQLKSQGLKEKPSSLNRHAKWWFEHFVEGMKYDDIANAEVEASLEEHPIIFARNVGRSVREFSKIIGINPKDLK
jgi:hypothetical protein